MYQKEICIVMMAFGFIGVAGGWLYWIRYINSLMNGKNKKKTKRR